MSLLTDIKDLEVTTDIPDGTSQALFDRLSSDSKLVYVPEVGDTHYMYKGPYSESDPTLRVIANTWLFIKGLSLPDETSFTVVTDTQKRYWIRFVRPSQFRRKFNTHQSGGLFIPTEIKRPDENQLKKVLFSCVVYFFLNLYPYMTVDPRGTVHLIDLITLTPEYTLELTFSGYPGFYKNNLETITKYVNGINPRIDAFSQAGVKGPSDKHLFFTREAGPRAI